MDEQGDVTFFLDFIVFFRGCFLFVCLFVVLFFLEKEVPTSTGPSCLEQAIMATEAGQDEEPVGGTSFSQPKENMDMHLTMAEQMHKMQQMIGAIMNKFQKWEAEHVNKQWPQNQIMNL